MANSVAFGVGVVVVVVVVGDGGVPRSVAFCEVVYSSPPIISAPREAMHEMLDAQC